MDIENGSRAMGEEGNQIETVEQMNSFIQIGYYETICSVHHTDNFHLTHVQKILSEPRSQYPLNDLMFIGNIIRLEDLMVGDL